MVAGSPYARSTEPRTLVRLQAFVAVARLGSFTKASKATGIDTSLLSRRVRELEDALGVQLLARTTRSVRATDEGAALFEATQEPFDAIASALEDVVAGDKIQGRVVVATFTALAEAVVVPAAIRLMQDYPALTVEVRSSEHIERFVDEGFDLAFRMGQLKDSALISRKLVTLRYLLVASRAWANKHATLTTPEQLAPHWVLNSRVAKAEQWRLENAGEVTELVVEPRLRIDDLELVASTVKNGHGVSALFGFHIDSEMRSGDVVRVAPAWRVASTWSIHAVYPSRKFMTRRARVVLEAITASLQAAAADWEAWAQ